MTLCPPGAMPPERTTPTRRGVGGSGVPVFGGHAVSRNAGAPASAGNAAAMALAAEGSVAGAGCGSRVNRPAGGGA